MGIYDAENNNYGQQVHVHGPKEWFVLVGCRERREIEVEHTQQLLLDSFGPSYSQLTWQLLL